MNASVAAGAQLNALVAHSEEAAMRLSFRGHAVRAGAAVLTAVALAASAHAGCTRKGSAAARTGPGAAGAEDLGPVDVARRYNAALRAGDAARALPFTDAATAAERQAVRIAAQVGAAEERFRRAIAKRFGADAAGEFHAHCPSDEEFDRAVLREQGSKILVLTGLSKDSTNEVGVENPTSGVYGMVRRDGRWLVDISAKRSPGTAKAHAAIGRAFARAADRTAAEVKAGKYEDADEAAGAMNERLFRDVETIGQAMPDNDQ